MHHELLIHFQTHIRKLMKIENTKKMQPKQRWGSTALAHQDLFCSKHLFRISFGNKCYYVENPNTVKTLVRRPIICSHSGRSWATATRAIESSRWRSKAAFQHQYYYDQGEKPFDRKTIPGHLFNILNKLSTIAGDRRLDRYNSLWRCYTITAITSVWRALVAGDRRRGPSVAKSCVASPAVADRGRAKSPV